MSTKKNKECCEALKQSFDFGDRKGLRGVLIVNLKTKAKRTEAVLFSGEHAKRGIIINFCPFCGKEVKPQESK